MAVRNGAAGACSPRGGGDVDLDRDRALVRRCQDGDGAAFAELYTQYHDRLFRFCVRRLLDRDEADEVTQEAFLRAWRALPSFAGGLRFYPWLSVIAKNLCTDQLRRRARLGLVEDFDRASMSDATRSDPFATTMSSEEAVMAAFDGSLVSEALMRLSERHREVLQLREGAGLSYQEIATAQGVEISTVETLLWRARQALKREYSALSGSRVMAGLLVASGALRRFIEGAARRATRFAQAISRLGPRNLVAAGAVTVALAGVAGAPSTPANAPAQPPDSVAAPPGQATTGAVLPAPSAPGLGAATPAPTTTSPSGQPAPSGQSGGSSTGAPNSTDPPSAAEQPAVSGPVSTVLATVPQIVKQVPTIVGTVPTIVGTVASGIGNVVQTVVSTSTSLLPSPSVSGLLGVVGGSKDA
jgi:RNA polymerase sigma-70 factor (ECF subfamily)